LGKIIITILGLLFAGRDPFQDIFKIESQTTVQLDAWHLAQFGPLIYGLGLSL
jgi:hypothetical protein